MTLHLSAQAVVDTCLQIEAGETVPASVQHHLSHCAACRARLADERDACAAAALTPDDERRLADLLSATATDARRITLQRRLEDLPHAARVLSFPATAPYAPTGRQWHWWWAAAAAAGLLVGIGVGHQWPARTAAPVALPAGAPLPVVPSPTPSAHRDAGPLAVSGAALPLDDDAFLLQLDAALTRPSSGALLPFDALTPSIVDVETVRR